MTVFTPSTFQTIRRIQILSTQLANDLLAGAYRSAFKGQGMEFEDVREYQSGDEIRSIDWNVTARMDHPYVKNYREERDITVIILVDVSASSLFGTHNGSKAALIAEIGAVLAFSAIKNNDKVGLILFSDGVEKYIPPRKGTRHVLRLIQEMLLFKPQKKLSNLNVALAFLGKIQRRSGICFIISDFLCSDFSHEASLIKTRQDLIAIRVTDPSEHVFPKLGIVHAVDLETNAQTIVDTSAASVQEAYIAAAKARTETFEKTIKLIGAGLIEVQTDTSYMTALHKFFKIRGKNRR